MSETKHDTVPASALDRAIRTVCSYHLSRRGTLVDVEPDESLTHLPLYAIKSTDAFVKALVQAITQLCPQAIDPEL